MRSLALLSMGLLPILDARNPIRKVVTLLQEMQTEIQSELDKEAANYKKFTCYCDKNSKDLDGELKQTAIDIKAARENAKRNQARADQLSEEVKSAKAELKDQRQRATDSQSQRDEERNKYNEVTKDVRDTLDATSKAIGALEKGMGIKPAAEEFLAATTEQTSLTAAQSKSRTYIRQLLSSNAVSTSVGFPAQQQLLNFLETKSSKSYGSQSGEIVGILKTIKENIDEELGGVLQAEEVAIGAFKKLKVSLAGSISALESQVEEKQVLKSQAALKAVAEKGIAEKKQAELGEANETALALKESCEQNVGDYATRSADGNNELKAIGAAIRVLNDDDALEKFKGQKDQTAAPEAFLQLSSKSRLGKKNINQVVQAINNVSSSRNSKLALLAMNVNNKLKTKAVDFSSVLTMIDEMVEVLKAEQITDVKSRESCIATLHQHEMELKALENSISGKQASSDDFASQIEVTQSNIKKDSELIAESEEDLKQAKAVREEEATEFADATQLNDEAIELLAKAKDKLNAYYNVAAVRRSGFNQGESDADAAARVLSDDYSGGGAEWNSAPVEEDFMQQAPARKTALKNMPETWEGGANRSNKSQKANGVLGLLDKLAGEMKQDNVARKTAEKHAIADYEKLVNNTTIKVSQLRNSVAEAEQTLSAAESSKLDTDAELDSKRNELKNLQQANTDMKLECDFILKNFESREDARGTEIEGLTKAKAVLNGANFAEPEPEE